MTGKNDIFMVRKVARAIARLDELYPGNWQKLSLSERYQVLTGCGERLASICGCPAPIAIATEISRRIEHQIFLDICLKDASYIMISQEEILAASPDEALDTYCHEYRHAYQLQQIELYEARVKGGAHDDAVVREPEERIKAWKTNFSNYISPPDDTLAAENLERYRVLLERYQKQTVERDAREFAAAIVRGVRHYQKKRRPPAPDGGPACLPGEGGEKGW